MNDDIIGCKVVLLTTTNQKLEGEIHAIDNRSNMVVLKRPGSKAGRSNLIFLKQNFIKDVTDVEPRKQQLENKIPYVNLDECKRREQKAVQLALDAASKIGVGVSKEAQGIFDALSKTLPCHWQGKSIVVMDSILIHEPYESENCQLVDEKDSHVAIQLKRIKFQLNNIRRSLNLSYEIAPELSPSPSPPPPQISAQQSAQTRDDNKDQGGE